MAFLILAFVPYVDQVTKRVFYYRGEGQPVSAAQLRRQILSVNRSRAPVMAEERLYDLVLTWKYTDVRWWEALAHAGLTGLYELHIKLDGKRHIATLIDVHKPVDWGTGPTQVRVGPAGRLVGSNVFRKVVCAREIGEQWGIQETWGQGEVYDHTFVPTHIKTPLMNSVLRSGWDVRFGIW
jgi:hypothetical protein